MSELAESRACRAPAPSAARPFPLVHCMTNDVVQTFTANVLLAVGASPAMVIDPREAAQFAAIADALLINVGTLDRRSRRGDARRGGARPSGRQALGRWIRWRSAP